MQIALLSGADPRFLKDCPIVRLQAGRWIIESNIRDSIAGIRLDNLVHEFKRDVPVSFLLESSTDAQVIIVEKGTEQYISVSAKKVA